MQVRQVEYGIITEAVIAKRREGQDSAALSLTDLNFAIGVGYGNDASELSMAFLPWHVDYFIQQEIDALFI
jgi:hypothetical protein